MDFFKKLLGSEEPENEENNAAEEKPAEDSAVTPPSEKTDATMPGFLLIKPASREELGEIADSLIAGRTVVLNLEYVTKDSRRFVDFLSGVVYALKGKIKKVAASTFLIIPGGVDITGDIFDDFEEEQY